ncbi:MAG: endonuclease/exonuclease/phosphatase family protein [Verrucomicrobia bacterium]|nr:endonuclease/exonuclease/phosphatase family protein [Verrucomicrobiota bacterium]
MRKIVGAGVVAGLLVLVSCDREKEIPKAVGVRDDGLMELNVMSFNIRYENDKDRGIRAWAERVVGVVGAVRGEKIDLLGIQEGLHGQVADLRASLMDYHFVGVGRDDGKRAGEYTGLFFRRDRFEKDEKNSGMIWLSATPEVPGSMTWGNQIPRIANWVRLVDRVSGRALWVVNVHLDHRSQESKEKAIRLLAEKLVEINSDSEPLVWMGDFNATEENNVIRFLSGKNSEIPKVDGFDGLVETYDSLHPGVKVRGSVNFWRNDPNLQWKLDHILVSNEAEILEARVMRHGEPYISDHFPVVARVRWR